MTPPVRPGAGRRLFGFLRPYRPLLLLELAAATLASVLDGVTMVLLIPLLKHLFGTAGSLSGGSSRLETLVDRLLAPLIGGQPPAAAAARIVALLFLAVLLKNALSYAAGQLTVRLQEGLVRELRARLFDHLLRLDLGFFQRTRGGQLIGRITQDADAAKGAVSAGLASFFQNLVVILTTLVLLTQLSWRLTLLALATAPLLLVGIRALLARLRRHARARADQSGEITVTAAERLGAIRLIRAYGGEERERDRFEQQVDRYRREVVRTQRFASLTSPVSEVFGALVLVLVIWAGTAHALGGAPLSPEALVVFIVGALKLMPPLKAITQFPGQLAMALAGAERVFDVLDRPIAEQEPPGLPAARFEQAIVFERVGFGYDGGDEVLSDVSFTLPKGGVVALVGPSGAGKTSLADLLPRFHEPTSGRILLDGRPLPAWSLRSLRELLGVVSQDTVLLHDSVHANIAYGRPTATRDQVRAAATAANAADFVSALPEGYDTLLGERGTRLSGGQRQRIAIARALLRDPPILILDEATSALDAESDRLVQEAIDRLLADRTVLVIAHRLSTIRHADLILVLDQGRIVERGTHSELLDQGGGLYRRLHDLQFRETLEPVG